MTLMWRGHRIIECDYVPGSVRVRIRLRDKIRGWITGKKPEPRIEGHGFLCPDGTFYVSREYYKKLQEGLALQKLNKVLEES